MHLVHIIILILVVIVILAQFIQVLSLFDCERIVLHLALFEVLLAGKDLILDSRLQLHSLTYLFTAETRVAAVLRSSLLSVFAAHLNHVILNSILIILILVLVLLHVAPSILLPIGILVGILLIIELLLFFFFELLGVASATY